MNSREIANSEEEIVRVIGSNILMLKSPLGEDRGRGKQLQFQLEDVLDKTSSQVSLFLPSKKHTTRHHESYLEGY